MDTESSFKPCECCETKIMGKPWIMLDLICKSIMYVPILVQHVLQKKYGGGYWENIINKEDFNGPRPVFEVYKIKQKD